ncbi:MAG: DUF192 domain-containing protein [Patescibacteria group bacterium]
MRHLIKHPKFWAGVLLIVIIGVFLYSLTLIPIDKYYPLSPDEQFVRLYVNDSVVYASVVQTPKERERGLSGRTGLSTQGGMLFIFPEDGKHSIWMKSMSFPIDIIWLNKDFRVVDSAEKVTPETYPASFASRWPARFVLEVPPGFIDSHYIVIGTEFRLAQ